MSEPLPIENGRVGIFHYVLRDDEGTVLDASQQGPMAFLAGASNLIPGLESELIGKKRGDAFTAVLSPADAYGELSGRDPVRVKKAELPKGTDWAAGMPIQTEQGGKPLTLWITKVEGAWCWLTLDHPLGGKTLHFEVQVVGCREASSEEKTHGHAHGVDGQGHHHGH